VNNFYIFILFIYLFDIRLNCNYFQFVVRCVWSCVKNLFIVCVCVPLATFLCYCYSSIHKKNCIVYFLFFKSI